MYTRQTAIETLSVAVCTSHIFIVEGTILDFTKHLLAST